MAISLPGLRGSPKGLKGLGGLSPLNLRVPPKSGAGGYFYGVPIIRWWDSSYYPNFSQPWDAAGTWRCRVSGTPLKSKGDNGTGALWGENTFNSMMRGPGNHFWSGAGGASSMQVDSGTGGTDEFWVFGMGAMASTGTFFVIGGGPAGAVNQWSSDGAFFGNNSGWDICSIGAGNYSQNNGSMGTQRAYAVRVRPGIDITAWVNGEDTARITITIPGGYVFNPGGVVLGTHGGGTDPSQYGDLLIVKGPITDIQRRAIEGYMMWSWCDINPPSVVFANMPAAHPFRSVMPPANPLTATV